MELEKKSVFDSFKFKDLKIYGSSEWLAGKKKKYRRVFDRSEATYVYAELSFLIKSLMLKTGT